MEFITMDMFLTLAGCVAAVAIITQALKTYFKKANALVLNFIVSIIVGIIRIVAIGDFTWEGIVLGVLNVFVIMFAAGGGYDVITSIITNLKTSKEAK